MLATRIAGNGFGICEGDLLTIKLNINGNNEKRFGILPQKCGGRLFNNTNKRTKVYYGDGTSLTHTRCCRAKRTVTCLHGMAEK